MMEKVNLLVIDKTGTITEGKPKLVEFNVESGFEKQTVLQLIASLERGSEHPLGLAIIEAAQKQGLSFESVDGFKSLTGKGIMGEVNNQTIAIGNDQLMKTLAINLPPLNDTIKDYRSQGQSVMFIAIDQRFAGFFASFIRLIILATVPPLNVPLVPITNSFTLDAGFPYFSTAFSCKSKHPISDGIESYPHE